MAGGAKNGLMRGFENQRDFYEANISNGWEFTEYIVVELLHWI
jgi:hypothetical protein